ncbi:MAG TPA: mechanosensitive ion channel domain-containing protein [Bacteroidia bacterium]|nr:mechanosensitive ion channel domain-containing protein [Bacteroidia bacterium]
MDVEKKKVAEAEVSRHALARKKVWVGTYLLLALAFITCYSLLKLKVFDIIASYREITGKVLLAGFFSMIILAVGKVVERIIIKRAKNRAASYNLIRLVRLLNVLIIALVAVSFIFTNWYAAAVSLGLISLILGFALQTPIASFIGWVYIIIRSPYHVGDRIQIGDFKGDVVEINYFDTTLWEFGGDYLSNDVSSGRLIRFPNSLVLEEAVYNYSWDKFPFIWNEIPFHVAYESDLEYVAATVRSVAIKELGDQMDDHIKRFKDLLVQTPVDDLEIKEYPFVSLRINTNTWVEVLVTYLVEPKKAAGVRTRLIKNAISELLKQPDKVMFPKSNNR